ncbi:type ISP restriction/modification enzyme [Joostella sp.]|uniref:type ISP restriction/modification enzyme n=1 Tax=Joostella sp. TaxID=2231138 RepID=UPI003A95128C
MRSPKRDIVNEISSVISLPFIFEQETEANVCYANSSELRDDYKTSFTLFDVLDYMYAVLHAPLQRESNKELININSNGLLLPKDTNTFWESVKTGRALRVSFILEYIEKEKSVATYPKEGDNIITTEITDVDWELYDAKNQLGRIWINKQQYFDRIPSLVWEFSIGDYKPAQNWLQNRKQKELKLKDILQYQRMIVTISKI